MNTLDEIRDFLQPRKFAIAGASRNPKKFGGVVLTELKKRGYELFPVHPEAKEIQGISCYSSVRDLPGEIRNLYVVTPKAKTKEVVEDALKSGIQKIWIQQNSETPEVLNLVKEKGLSLISGRCILMFGEPVQGVHGFHRWLSRLFGAYPK